MNFDKPGIVENNYRDVISSVEEIIEDARNGRMFVLIDHEDRENAVSYTHLTLPTTPYV